MADTTTTTVAATPKTAPSQEQMLESLKNRADVLGVGYGNDISIDLLRAKIKAHQDKAESKVDGMAPAESKAEWEARTRKEMHEQHMRLIRVRIVNLNPQKADLPGEIWTFSNKYLGTVRRYIPYGEKTDDGWHVESCLLELMKERRFAQLKTRTGDRGQLIPEQRMVKEFAIEELEPLSQEELDELKRHQAAADGKVA